MIKDVYKGGSTLEQGGSADPSPSLEIFHERAGWCLLKIGDVLKHLSSTAPRIASIGTRDGWLLASCLYMRYYEHLSLGLLGICWHQSTYSLESYWHLSHTCNMIWQIISGLPGLNKMPGCMLFRIKDFAHYTLYLWNPPPNTQHFLDVNQRSYFLHNKVPKSREINILRNGTSFNKWTWTWIWDKLKIHYVNLFVIYNRGRWSFIKSRSLEILERF